MFESLDNKIAAVISLKYLKLLRPEQYEVDIDTPKASWKVVVDVEPTLHVWLNEHHKLKAICALAEAGNALWPHAEKENINKPYGDMRIWKFIGSAVTDAYKHKDYISRFDIENKIEVEADRINITPQSCPTLVEEDVVRVFANVSENEDLCTIYVLSLTRNLSMTIPMGMKDCVYSPMYDQSIQKLYTAKRIFGLNTVQLLSIRDNAGKSKTKRVVKTLKINNNKHA